MKRLAGFSYSLVKIATMRHMSEELISAFDIRGTEESGLTVECAWNVGKALADWLPNDGNIVVMYIPAYQHVAEAVIEGLRLQGRNVVDAGFGDKEAVKSHIKTSHLAGGAVIGFDELEKVTTIELYQEEAKPVVAESGLKEIRELVQGGNFVPAVVKGQLLQAA
jgi:phosphomannomutase